MQGISFQPWEKLPWHNYFTSENKGTTCENQIVEVWERALSLVCPSARTIISLSCTGFHYRTEKWFKIAIIFSGRGRRFREERDSFAKADVNASK